MIVLGGHLTTTLSLLLETCRVKVSELTKSME